MSSEDLQQAIPTFSWQYIAGLFDGEGCVSCVKDDKYPRIRIYIAQSGEVAQTILQDLQLWLQQNGIEGGVRSEKYTGNARPDCQLTPYRLYVWKQASIITFLNGVLPYLHFKVIQVQDAILKYESLRRGKQASYLPFVRLDCYTERCAV